MTVSDEKYSVKSESAIILSPTTTYSYHAQKSNHTDDWFFFDPTDEDITLLSEMGIPIDHPTYLGTFEELSKLIYEMTIEFYSASVHHSDIVSFYTEILFRHISRICAEKSSREAHSKSARRTDLAYLRSQRSQKSAGIITATPLWLNSVKNGHDPSEYRKKAGAGE